MNELFLKDLDVEDLGLFQVLYAGCDRRGVDEIPYLIVKRFRELPVLLNVVDTNLVEWSKNHDSSIDASKLIRGYNLGVHSVNVWVDISKNDGLFVVEKLVSRFDARRSVVDEVNKDFDARGISHLDKMHHGYHEQVEAKTDARLYEPSFSDSPYELYVERM